jgi:hypothetical protein
VEGYSNPQAWVPDAFRAKSRVAVTSWKNGQEQKRKATNALSRIHPGYGLRGLIVKQTRGFPLVAARMLVLVMPVSVNVFVSVDHRLVAMLVAVVGVGAGLVAVLVLMLVLTVATHPASPPFDMLFII